MSWNTGLEQGTPAYGIAADQSQYVRVVAGPGTGKSFALKRRVARLLEAEVKPERILPVTFTKVAAEDLQREMMQIGVTGCDLIRGSTLHALGMKMLGRQNVLSATGRVARPLNTFEIEPFLHDLKGIFGTKRQIEKRIRAYEAAWARLQHEEPGYAQKSSDQQFEQELIGWLKFHQGMLIGEIIPQLYQYLRNNPAAVERTLYDHVLVDEYQDLNKAEQAVVDLLSESANLCIVGDDDQSLYSFKHAHPAGIRTFNESHSGSTDHAVLTCRRCPVQVVDLANSLIKNNQDREDRQLSPMASNGLGVVKIVQFRSLAIEAKGIAEWIADQVREGIYQPADILVLAQRRIIGNQIHDALVAKNVPSKSYYKEGELENATAQERLAILKLLINTEDRIALRWLLGFKHNDFHKNAYARVRSHCNSTGLSPWQVLCQLQAGELAIPHTGILIKTFAEIRSEVEALRAVESVQAVVDQWLDENSENLNRLRDLVLEFAPDVATPDELLEKLVEAISTPEIPPDVTEVRIMSLHKSKGLSSPVVIIAGCIEGLLPVEPDVDMTPEESAACSKNSGAFFMLDSRV